jgi:hypothetical protein
MMKSTDTTFGSDDMNKHTTKLSAAGASVQTISSGVSAPGAVAVSPK